MIFFGKWSIGDSYFLDLPAHGYALLRFYEISLGAVRLGQKLDLERVFAVDRFTREFMTNFGMLIGDGGKFLRKEIDKIQRRQQIIDLKINKDWIDMLIWIEEHHLNGEYKNIKSFNGLADLIKQQIAAVDHSSIHNYSKKTIIRCLKQVYQLKPERPFSLPRVLKRKIDYNM